MLKRQYLSVVLITNNEEELLLDCLISISWADEIIILDAGSHDNTCHIALKAGAKVFQSTDWKGFGIQRQRAQTYASGDYILMIDADERVTPQLRKAIQKMLEKPQSGKVYSCSRRNLFLGRFIRYGGWYPDRVIRLYERKKHRYNTRLVHESLDVDSTTSVVNLQGDLQHITCRYFSKFQHKQLKYAEDWAIEHNHLGFKCSLFTIVYHTYSAFIRSWLLRAGFLDGKQGWLLAMVTAQYTFNKYTILWSLKNTEKRKIYDNKRNLS